MNNKEQKYEIKIPNKTILIYHKEKKTLTIIGPVKRKTIKLELKIFIDNFKKTIIVKSVPFSRVPNNKKKKIKSLKNTITALIKHMLIETSTLVYKKLEIVGVGYKVFFTETLNQKLITLKLGYSHLIYFRIPSNITMTYSTKTKFCLSGYSYQNIAQITASIRSHKIPEPYKGKGLLYDNENIVLKEGKKI